MNAKELQHIIETTIAKNCTEFVDTIAAELTQKLSTFIDVEMERREKARLEIDKLYHRELNRKIDED